VNIGSATWVDVEDRLRRTRRALIPVGAVEVYGPHLPQGTDGIVAAALCEEVGRRTGCLVAPLVPVGWSESLASFPGTLSVSPEVVKSYCAAVVASLYRWGVRSILLLNTHLGNVACLQDLCLEQDRPAEGRRLIQIDLWRYIQPFTADLLRSPSWKFGHAGECMTAVMLHLRPDLVRMDRAGRFLPAEAVVPPGVIVPRPYRDQAPHGFFGDATLATVEVGRQIVERCVEQLVAFLGREFGKDEEA
jgi:creatinine amidohydrolase